MAKIKLEFDGAIEHLTLGIQSLARSVGWVVGSSEDPIPLAKTALSEFTRNTVLNYQKQDADIATQAAVDAALAQKEATLAAIEAGTLGALDAVTLTVEVIEDDE